MRQVISDCAVGEVRPVVEFETVLKSGMQVTVIATGTVVPNDIAIMDPGYTPAPAHVEGIHLEVYADDQPLNPAMLDKDWDAIEQRAAEKIFEEFEGGGVA